MTIAIVTNDRPHYDQGDRAMLLERAPRAGDFARLILDTSGPFLSASPADLRVLDVGCGYGHTSVELARRCREVVAIEPSSTLARHAARLASEAGLTNIEVRQESVRDLKDEARYDLVVLDNVLEHLDDQALALRRIEASLRPGGAVWILVPNKLWPLEVHYRLPFLSYLPLRIANFYLRITRRGHDYTDASFAPTYWGLKRLLAAQGDLAYRFVLPPDLSLATHGPSWHYSLGAAAIRRCPWLWAISKVLLVVAVKT